MFLPPQYLPARNPLRRGASTKHRDVQPVAIISVFVSKYRYIYGKEPNFTVTYWGQRWHSKGIWHDWDIELQHK